MRVISMVPSLTETLIMAGVNVVGRTRFCIHPAKAVQSIPVVGGTKQWDLQAITALRPDLILLDRDENPRFMSEQAPVSWLATRVDGVCDMPLCLNELAAALSNSVLSDFAERWQTVVNHHPLAPQQQSGFAHLPGLVRWGRRPQGQINTTLYLIWKDPWMAAGHDSFTGSMLAKLGVSLPAFASKYPLLELTAYDPQSTLLLLPSEPYPFADNPLSGPPARFPHAYLEGESFCWFGIRSLKFLERALPQATG